MKSLCQSRGRSGSVGWASPINLSDPGPTAAAFPFWATDGTGLTERTIPLPPEAIPGRRMAAETGKWAVNDSLLPNPGGGAEKTPWGVEKPPCDWWRLSPTFRGSSCTYFSPQVIYPFECLSTSLRIAVCLSISVDVCKLFQHSSPPKFSFNVCCIFSCASVQKASQWCFSFSLSFKAPVSVLFGLFFLIAILIPMRRHSSTLTGVPTFAAAVAILSCNINYSCNLNCCLDCSCSQKF